MSAKQKLPHTVKPEYQIQNVTNVMQSGGQNGVLCDPAVRYYVRKQEKTVGHESEKFSDEIPWQNELREIPSLNKSALVDMYSSNKSIFRISVGLLF